MFRFSSLFMALLLLGLGACRSAERREDDKPPWCISPERSPYAGTRYFVGSGEDPSRHRAILLAKEAIASKVSSSIRSYYQEQGTQAQHRDVKRGLSTTTRFDRANLIQIIETKKVGTGFCVLAILSRCQLVRSVYDKLFAIEQQLQPKWESLLSARRRGDVRRVASLRQSLASADTKVRQHASELSRVGCRLKGRPLERIVQRKSLIEKLREQVMWIVTFQPQGQLSSQLSAGTVRLLESVGFQAATSQQQFSNMSRQQWLGKIQQDVSRLYLLAEGRVEEAVKLVPYDKGWNVYEAKTGLSVKLWNPRTQQSFVSILIAPDVNTRALHAKREEAIASSRKKLQQLYTGLLEMNLAAHLKLQH